MLRPPVAMPSKPAWNGPWDVRTRNPSCFSIPAMFLDQRNKILRCETRQCRLAEMWILGNELGWRSIYVGEIAAAAAGNENFAAYLLRMIEQSHTPASLCGLSGAHHAGASGSHDNHVKFFHDSGVCAGHY